MLIIFRNKAKAFDNLLLNALAFTGQIILKNQKDLEIFSNNNPIDLLTDVCLRKN